METLNCIKTRKSVRKFKNIKIEDEKIKLILSYAFQCPSACDIRPWELIVVNDENVLKKLNIKAPLSIFVCGRENNEFTSYKPFLSETWLQDCSALSQNILLIVHDLGLGGCWHILHPLEKYDNYKEYVGIMKDILNIPSDIKPLCHIDIGYSDENNNDFKNKYDLSKIYFNSYGRK